MKICILTPRFPFPENGGDVLRINNIARYLKAQNHRLVLLSFVEGKELPMKQAYELYDKIYTVRRSQCGSLLWSFLFLFSRRPIQCGYYRSWRMKRLLSRIIREEQPTLFISHLLRMTPYLDRDGLRERSIIEMTDVLSKTYSFFRKSFAKSMMGMIYQIEHRRMLAYEAYAARRFPKCVLVSHTDVQNLQQRAPEGQVVLHTNGVTASAQPEQEYNPNKICFVGNMRTLQNRDAVLYFVQEVFPIILSKRPKAIFYIVGAQPPEMIQSLANDKHIVVTNYVDNVELVIADSCLTVAPIRIAAGIQNKVLVSMGQQVPVVLTSLIAKPIPELQSGDNCLVADTRQELADACLKLMNSRELRNKIAQSGYQMVRTHYTWEAKLNGYELLNENIHSQIQTL